jgi:hypothetical protein
LQHIIDLKQLAREIGNTFVIRKYKGIEFSKKLNKLPGTRRTPSAEYI